MTTSSSRQQHLGFVRREVAATGNVKALDPEDAPVPRANPGLTARDEVERRLLVRIRPGLFRRAVDSQQSERFANEVTQAYDQRLEAALDRARTFIEERALTTPAAITREYGELERIELPGGESVEGAEVARAGPALLIYSVAGLIRKNTDK